MGQVELVRRLTGCSRAQTLTFTTKGTRLGHRRLRSLCLTCFISTSPSHLQSKCVQQELLTTVSDNLHPQLTSSLCSTMSYNHNDALS